MGQRHINIHERFWLTHNFLTCVHTVPIVLLWYGDLLLLAGLKQGKIMVGYKSFTMLHSLRVPVLLAERGAVLIWDSRGRLVTPHGASIVSEHAIALAWRMYWRAAEL